ncbi:hypothetical protein [Parasphingorhabdus pacifica]
MRDGGRQLLGIARTSVDARQHLEPINTYAEALSANCRHALPALPVEPGRTG